MNALEKILTQMLAIPSPTGQEQDFVAWLRGQALAFLPGWDILEHSDCLILSSPQRPSLPHIALVGHSDVVPAFFEPRVVDGRLFGAGASDMKGALAAFWHLLVEHADALCRSQNVSLIVYSREEQTPLVENGLYHLLQAFPAFFQSLDLAIVGEPTDNTLQLGCVGSIHARVTVKGLACHSARPWNGENALYKAIPFLQAMAALEPVRHTVFGLDFFDVLQVTESSSEPGRTSLPGWWRANVNFRFAPVRSEAEAQVELTAHLLNFGIAAEGIEIFDSVPAGSVIESALFRRTLERLDLPLQAKQAWTDVAQLTAREIPAFNFGPGLTAQAHKADEYILLSDLADYYQHLLRLFGLTAEECA
ncbi:MAG: succinyl-diaminopimelate desuccinylase [Candidatus Melainabacteria bacterium HGW-Melainabacteria-1]|nr:MAG: succinyl-diaminopimelate desuccinylase [Candidatus Melainabacteria bacterium HGW-Melainabacteria-1]